jgi:hypothetical protein
MTIKSRFPNSEKRKLGLLMTDEQKIERIQKWDDEDFEIMLKLCEEHGVTSWYGLALKLAKELYTERKKKGRKTKWDDYAKGVLVVEVERLSKDTKTIESACYQLSKIEPWKSFVEKKESSNTAPDAGAALNEQYADFKNDKWAEISRNAYFYHVETNKIDEWEKQVLKINSRKN